MGVKLGEIYYNSKGSPYEIIDCTDYHNVKVVFLETGNTKTTHISNVIAGSIKDSFHRSVHGIGFLGEGPYKVSVARKITPEYSVWEKMLSRCYIYKECTTYYNICEIDPMWFNFQEFARFYVEHPFRIEGWDLDKDILVKGNKLYSPETCCFVPNEINKAVQLSKPRKDAENKLPVGVRFDDSLKKSTRKYMWRCVVPDGTTNIVGRCTTPEEAFHHYKIAKEARLRFLANKWKDDISPDVYIALLNFKVEITD